MIRQSILLLLLSGSALGQTAGTLNLVGPTTQPGAPQITPTYINAGVNAQLATKADASGGHLANPTFTGTIGGLAPSATTDTTNAANITSGTLPAARLPAAAAQTGVAATFTAKQTFSGGLALTGFTSGALLCVDGSGNITTSNCAGSSAPGYYLSANGSDANDGLTPATPVLSLTKAQTLMRGGSTKRTYVMSDGGNFTLGSTFTMTSSDNGESFINYSTETPIFDGGGTLVNFINLNATTSVTIQGLTLQHGAVGRAAIIMNGGTTNRVLANHVTNVGEGILVEGETQFVIRGNQIDTILGDATGGTTPGNCTIPAGTSGRNCNGSDIELQNQSNYGDVSYNLLKDSFGVSTHGGGVYAHGANSNTITHNFFRNNFGMAIGLVDFDTSGHGTHVTNNLVQANASLDANTGSGDSGTFYDLGRDMPTQGNTFDHNFASHSNLVNTSANNLSDYYADDCSSGNTYSNNAGWGFGNGASGSGGRFIEIHVGSNNSFPNNLAMNMATNANQLVLVQSSGGSGTCPTTMAGNTMTNVVATSSKTSAVSVTTFSGDTPNLTVTTATLFGQGVTTTWSTSLGAGSGVTITGQTTTTNPGLPATTGITIVSNAPVYPNITLSNPPSGWNQIVADWGIAGPGLPAAHWSFTY